MRSRFPILIAMTCLVIAVVAGAGAAGTERRSSIPACEQLLAVFEAEIVMREPTASILTRAVIGGSTRACAYVGVSKKSVGHSLELEWGPFADRRKLAAPWAKKFLCPVSKTACTKFITAATLKPERRSFAGLELALGQVGVTRWLRDPAFDNNPTFVWLPSRRLAPIDEIAFVAVYVVRSGMVLEVGCTDNDAHEADLSCARKAAAFAYDSVP